MISHAIRPAAILLGCLLLVGLIHGTAAAQRRFAIVGMVQWTAGSRLQLMTESGATISFDVSRLDQSQYGSLRGGQWVRIIGYVGTDTRVPIAESLEIADDSPGYWEFPQTG